MGCFLPDLTIILRETLQSGANVKFFVPAWAVTPKLIETIGPATEGIMTADFVSALDSDAFAQFSKRFKEVVARIPRTTTTRRAPMTWYRSLALAIQAAGPSADAKALAGTMRPVNNPPGTKVSSFAEGKKLLEAGQKINYEGASRRLDFDEKGDVKALFKLSVIKGGQMTQLRVLK